MEMLTGRRYQGIGLGLAMWICLAAPAAIRAQTASPSRLRAAYIYNFAKFVQWPSSTSSGGSKSLVFCVYGKDSVGNALQQEVGGRTINGKSVIVKTVSNPSQAQTCQVLYVGPSANERLSGLFSNLQGAPVLTIGETPNFASAGGIIGFEVKSKQLRFVINVRAATKARLKISSRLLSLATRVQQ